VQKLTVFISSTVKDFGPVRADLREWLTGLDMNVRISENDDFPVDHAVSSHDACLRAISGCHLAVVLIGERRGGLYAGTPKSITRREFEEAVRLEIPTIVLVRDEVNRRAEQWSRNELSEPPFGDHTGGIVEFINYVRKDRLDNWFHEWDGSFFSARRIIHARMNALFTRYQKPHVDLQRRAKGLVTYAQARFQIDQMVVALLRVSETSRDKVEILLGVVADSRSPLFGFEKEDRWNFAVYAPDADGDLKVFARQLHPDIPRRDRSWRSGQGHVGAAWAAGRTLIAADLSVTSAWEDALATDAENYRSAIAEPIFDPAGRQLLGVLLVTSSRLDHFRDAQDPHVLTARSLALVLQAFLKGGSDAST
jgi:hypothetical protein